MDARDVAGPRDTLAPMVVAAGATLVLAGIVTSPIVSAVGAALLVLGLARWIDDVLREGEAP